MPTTNNGRLCSTKLSGSYSTSLHRKNGIETLRIYDVLYVPSGIKRVQAPCGSSRADSALVSGLTVMELGQPLGEVAMRLAVGEVVDQNDT